MQKSEVVFPLSRTLALAGVFDGQEGVCRVEAGMVEAINGMIIGNADWQIYATDDAFKYLLSIDQGSRTGDQLLLDWLSDLQTD